MFASSNSLGFWNVLVINYTEPSLLHVLALFKASKYKALVYVAKWIQNPFTLHKNGCVISIETWPKILLDIENGLTSLCFYDLKLNIMDKYFVLDARAPTRWASIHFSKSDNKPPDSIILAAGLHNLVGKEHCTRSLYHTLLRWKK